jgi:hypothetical protein
MSARLVLALCAAAVLGGCGVGAGDEPDRPVSLTVTRGFGSEPLVSTGGAPAAASDTVLRLLQRNADVRTRFGGGFVQSIDGVEGGREDGRPVDWFFYVNGIEADRGAAERELNSGDRVWWDHHDWGATMRVPAVVGSFPEPFLSGDEGRRLPVRVECEDPDSAACDAVAERLVGLGIPAGRGGLGTTTAEETARVIVATWRGVRGRDIATDRLDSGPEASGVFATFADDARTLTVLDVRGRPARRLGAGTGLIAATRVEERQPVWFVTGTDAAGVDSAARAFDEATLRDRFALAISDDRAVAVPAVAEETG